MHALDRKQRRRLSYWIFSQTNISLGKRTQPRHSWQSLEWWFHPPIPPALLHSISYMKGCQEFDPKVENAKLYPQIWVMFQ